MSEYSPPLETQPFDQWLDEVIQELSELGYQKKLDEAGRAWLYDIWDNYDLSAAEAALSFINETPA